MEHVNTDVSMYLPEIIYETRLLQQPFKTDYIYIYIIYITKT